MSNYNSSAQTQLFDTISLRDICISGVSIGANKKVLLDTFGKPDSIIFRVNEFEGTEFQQFMYLNSSFSISGDCFTSFDLRDSRFQFDYGDIKIGDPGIKIKSIFPRSYANRELGSFDATIRVRMANLDSYVLFVIDNDVITRIQSWDDM